MTRDVAEAIATAIAFAFPIGAIVMHRHYRGATGWLRWTIIAIRVLAVISAPYALLILISVVQRWTR